MANSVLGKLIEQAVADAKTVALVDIPDAHIVPVGGFSATTFENQLPGVPAVAIGPFGSENSPPPDGSNERDDFTYPILVAIVDAANQDHDFEELDKRWFWRQKLIDQFHFQVMSPGLDSGDHIMLQTVDLFPIIDQTAWQNNWWLSAFTLNVKVRQNRP